MSLPPHVQADDRIVLFDGVCKLCNGWSRFLIKHDVEQQFKLCSVQSAEGRAILEWFGMPTDTFDTMLLVDGAVAYEKSDAFLNIVARLPRPWRYLKLLRFVPLGLRNWFYDRIALNRYSLFGRYDACPLPSEKDRERFLGHG